MLYLSSLIMEININCDLGEKSPHHSNENDPELLKIVNSANIACGYHAGDEETMREVIKISKENGVSIGAHPSFNDPDNFGRERMNLSSNEIRKLIIDQYEILQKIADQFQEKVTHIKPHGALNNMACEIFADRNYEEDGNLVSRKKPHALITDPEEAKKHVLTMVQEQSLNCFSGKKIPCEIDSICIHGDNISSLETAKSINKNLIENGIVLKSLSSMSKFS